MQTLKAGLHEVDLGDRKKKSTKDKGFASALRNSSRFQSRDLSLPWCKPAIITEILKDNHWENIPVEPILLGLGSALMTAGDTLPEDEGLLQPIAPRLTVKSQSKMIHIIFNDSNNINYSSFFTTIGDSAMTEKKF